MNRSATEPVADDDARKPDVNPTPTLPEPAPADWDLRERGRTLANRLTLGILLLDRARRELRRLVRDHKPVCPRKGKKPRSCSWCNHPDSECDTCSMWHVLRQVMRDDIDAEATPAKKAAEQMSSFTNLWEEHRARMIVELEDIVDRIARAR